MNSAVHLDAVTKTFGQHTAVNGLSLHRFPRQLLLTAGPVG
jgi:ABC-type uncharacterized transport system ATPase subunit